MDREVAAQPAHAPGSHADFHEPAAVRVAERRGRRGFAGGSEHDGCGVGPIVCAEGGVVQLRFAWVGCGSAGGEEREFEFPALDAVGLDAHRGDARLGGADGCAGPPVADGGVGVVEEVVLGLPVQGGGVDPRADLHRPAGSESRPRLQVDAVDQNPAAVAVGHPARRSGLHRAPAEHSRQHRVVGDTGRPLARRGHQRGDGGVGGPAAAAAAGGTAPAPHPDRATGGAGVPRAAAGIVRTALHSGPMVHAAAPVARREPIAGREGAGTMSLACAVTAGSEAYGTSTTATSGPQDLSLTSRTSTSPKTDRKAPMSGWAAWGVGAGSGQAGYPRWPRPAGRARGLAAAMARDGPPSATSGRLCCAHAGGFSQESGAPAPTGRGA